MKKMTWQVLLSCVSYSETIFVKRLVLSYLIGIAFPLTTMAALQVSQTAPEFSAPASLAGTAFTFSLKQALKKGPVVVYFYPSAYTGGCNIQAHTFAVENDKFAAAGVSIIGVSLDSITRLNAFSADPDYCAGKIPVASDADGAIAKSYDLSIREAVAGRKDSRGIEIDHGFAERTTFIVTPDGKIAATIGGLPPADNVAKALEFVQQLAPQAKSPSPSR